MVDDKSRSPIAENLLRSRLGGDLLAFLQRNAETATPENLIPVLIEGNAGLPQGAGQARRVLALAYAREHAITYMRGDRDWVAFLARAEDPVVDAGALFAPEDKIDLPNSFWTDYYLFGLLTLGTIERLARLTVHVLASPGKDAQRLPLVHKLWLNHPLRGHIYESLRTVKCDAAQIAFSARGDGVVWAVADTGIDRRHPHFTTLSTLDLPDGLQHHDFTDSGDPLNDEDGHGSHVAGIIAGHTYLRPFAPVGPVQIAIAKEVRISDSKVDTELDTSHIEMAGLAPLAKLMSLKVLRQSNGGDVGSLLAAIGYIQKANDYGANLRIHGVNLSLGYGFDARWFGTGRSPLCVEVDRLVRSGVVVVVAAGNSGYGPIQTLNLEIDQAVNRAGFVGGPNS